MQNELPTLVNSIIVLRTSQWSNSIHYWPPRTAWFKTFPRRTDKSKSSPPCPARSIKTYWQVASRLTTSMPETCMCLMPLPSSSCLPESPPPWLLQETFRIWNDLWEFSNAFKKLESVWVRMSSAPTVRVVSYAHSSISTYREPSREWPRQTSCPSL